MIECTKFKPFQKGYLQGFADIHLPKWGIEICGCSLYEKDGKRWVNVPGKEYTNAQGEKKYSPFLRFKQKEHWELFCQRSKEAIDAYCKEQRVEEEILHGTPNQDDEEVPF